MKKAFLGLLFIGLTVIVFILFKDHLNFSYFQQNLERFQYLQSEHELTFAFSFALIYVLLTALSIPGAAILTLVAGALFGLAEGVLIVSFASTIGATLAFLASRYFLRDWVRSRFAQSFQKIDSNFQKQGSLYLLSLRLAPIFPFFMVNLVMGLTPIRTSTYYIFSQLGMLAGTVVFVNAGVQLSRIHSMKYILSGDLLGALIFLALVPWLGKFLISRLESRKVYRGFKKPKKFDYNVLVIGAGAAGLVTSYIAAAVKAKVALVESEKMGGDCLNTGCVPSKALIKSAKVSYQIKNSLAYGIESQMLPVSFSDVLQRINKVIKKIEPHDSTERYGALGVHCYSGKAHVVSPFEVEVNGRVLAVANIVVASGAEPFLPPFPGLEKINYFTSNTIWNLKELPKKLLIVGGGAIGCEFAQAFARLGSEVTVVERGDRLLAKEDPEASLHILRQFEKENIRVILKATVQSFADGSASIQSTKGILSIDFSEVLLALGRRARIEGFGLEKLGIEINPAGTIDHDEFMATKFPNIFVCGDVAGPFQFTHTASHQAWYAAVNSLFAPFARFKADYRVIPRCTFTDPEVASVGRSEAELQNDKEPYEIVTYPLSDLDRAICEGEDEGFVKVMTKKGTDQILGVTIVGSRAGDSLTEFVLAMRWKLGLQKILATVHSYPTFSEANKAVAGRWRQMHTNPRVLNFLERFHNWKRS